MTKLQNKLFAFFILFAFVVLPTAQSMAGQPQSLKVTPLVVETSAGQFEFEVELAASQTEHEIGLMFRHQMDDNHGMLFINEEVRYNSFWMKNTYISLDIIFIKADGTIQNIVANTIPLSLDSVPSTGPVIAILELNAGKAQAMKLKAGDQIFHEAFGNLP